jgi:hypothetical protein
MVSLRAKRSNLRAVEAHPGEIASSRDALLTRNKAVRNGDNLERFPGEKPGSIAQRHEQRVDGSRLSPGQRAACGFIQDGSAGRQLAMTF